jgi:spore maturation protein A
MEELGRSEEDRRNGKSAGPVRKRGIASNEMCTFLIINISSLQLIPVNVIAYRSQYGSVDPAAVVGPGIAATAVSTVVAMIFCKMMDGKRRM